jgi:hypothetical protein
VNLSKKVRWLLVGKKATVMTTQPQTSSGLNQAKINAIADIEWKKAKFAALIPSAALVPIVAAFMSVATYASLLLMLGPEKPFENSLPLIAVGGGTLVVLAIWIIVGICRRDAGNVNYADIARFEMIMRRLTQMTSWLVSMKNHQTHCDCPGLTGLCKEAKRLQPLIDLSRQEACDTVQAIYEVINRKQNLPWVLAIGYLDIWERIHRVDEAFIYLEPRELVIRDALHDESCIENSAINNREELLANLRTAVTTLDAKAAKYLNQQAPKQAASVMGNSMMPEAPQNAGQAIITNAQGKAITSTATQKCLVCCDHESGETQARAIIKEVRFTLHKFRDDRWEKLVRVRILLMKQSVFAAVFSYILLEFAIIAGASLETLKAATTFYLIGVIAALFKRLYDQSKSDASLDDHNLANVRIVAAVVFSGLAAVGGVLVQMFIAHDNSLGLSLSLQNIFVAAAFGLTPSLFVTAIQKQADQYKSDLKSTETSSGGTTKTTVPS